MFTIVDPGIRNRWFPLAILAVLTQTPTSRNPMISLPNCHRHRLHLWAIDTTVALRAGLQAAPLYFRRPQRMLSLSRGLREGTQAVHVVSFSWVSLTYLAAIETSGIFGIIERCGNIEV